MTAASWLRSSVSAAVIPAGIAALVVACGAGGSEGSGGSGGIVSFAGTPNAGGASAGTTPAGGAAGAEPAGGSAGDNAGGSPAAAGASAGSSSPGGSSPGGSDTAGSGGEGSGGSAIGLAGAAGAGGSDGSAGATMGNGGNGGNGGSDAEPPSRTPYAFSGSTDGNLRAFAMNAADGSLSPAGSVDVGDDLDFVALGPDDRTVFVGRNGLVAAYAYDPLGQSFGFVDEANTAGVGTHVAVDPTGTRVFVAHYNEGALSSLLFTADIGFSGFLSVQPGQNTHSATLDPSGSHVFVPCLGANHVAQYDLSASGVLTPASTPTVNAAGGPRHMTFNSDGSRAYLITENSSQVHVFDVDGSGLLQLRGGASTFTSDDQQYHWSSDVRITPDDRFVYAVNRDPAQVVAFAVQGDGSLVRQPGAAQPLGGEVRAFTIEAGGEFLLAGDSNGNLVSYRIGGDGALSESARTTGLGIINVTLSRYLD